MANLIVRVSSLLTLLILASWSSVAQSGVVVCYYGSWASYRSGNGKFTVNNIDPDVCTHVIYSFAGLDQSTNKIKSLDPNLDLPSGQNNYGAFIGLKTKNPSLKLLLAIGGWNEGTYKFSVMSSSASSRSTFIASVSAYLRQYKFDGLDVDWEFPSGSDKQNFVLLLQELRTELNKYGLMLTIAIGAGKYTIDTAYNLPAISNTVDHIHVMNYDYHGSWETATGHNAPLYARPDESPDYQLLNTNFTIQYLLALGASANKLVMGIPLYAVTYTLVSATNNGLYAPASGPGYPGPYTAQDGFLGYNEIVEKFNAGGWTIVRDDIQKVPRAYKGNQWMGYDDVASVTEKINLAKSCNLLGGMVWSIETDDYLGLSGTKYPILSTIKQVLGSGGATSTTTSGTTTTTTPTPTTTTTAATTTTKAATTTKATTTKAPTTTAAPATTTAAPATTTAAPTTTTAASATTAVNPGGTTAYVLSRCPEGKSIRDPNDCTKFYDCVEDGSSYRIYESQCQYNLVYDEVNQYCNYKDEVPGC
ncbi:Chitinase 2 [Chamberlinius hualienensis]